MVRATHFAALLAGALALLTAAAVGASDDDEDPPYMIYIDPESGKYTTVDPLAAPPDARAKALPGPVDGAGTLAAPKSPWVLVAGAAGAVLLVLGGHRMRRRRRRLTTGKHLDRPA